MLECDWNKKTSRVFSVNLKHLSLYTVKNKTLRHGAEDFVVGSVSLSTNFRPIPIR